MGSINRMPRVAKRHRLAIVQHRPQLPAAGAHHARRPAAVRAAAKGYCLPVVKPKRLRHLEANVIVPYVRRDERVEG